MTGWKTWLGAFLIGGSGAAAALGHPELGAFLFKLGGTFAVVGIGHKIQKAANGK